MKKLFWLLLAFPFLAYALLLGAANADKITLDLLFFSFEQSAGVVLVAAISSGFLLSTLLIYFVKIIPLQQKNNQLTKKMDRIESGTTEDV